MNADATSLNIYAVESLLRTEESLRRMHRRAQRAERMAHREAKRADQMARRIRQLLTSTPSKSTADTC